MEEEEFVFLVCPKFPLIFEYFSPGVEHKSQSNLIDSIDGFKRPRKLETFGYFTQ